MPSSRANVRRAAEGVCWAVGGVIVAGLISLAFSYGLRLRDTVETGSLPKTAIVFTGQFDRVEKVLALREAGQVDRIFISGVNPGAGMHPTAFAYQFKLSPALQDDLKRGVITLGPEAQDTFENALETTCWLDQQPGIDRVLLITTQAHMPRASLLLERASGLPVERLSTAAARVSVSALLSREFRSFVATWFISFAPPRMWPSRSGFVCRQY